MTKRRREMIVMIRVAMALRRRITSPPQTIKVLPMARNPKLESRQKFAMYNNPKKTYTPPVILAIFMAFSRLPIFGVQNWPFQLSHFLIGAHFLHIFVPSCAVKTLYFVLQLMQWGIGLDRQFERS